MRHLDILDFGLVFVIRANKIMDSTEDEQTAFIICNTVSVRAPARSTNGGPAMYNFFSCLSLNLPTRTIATTQHHELSPHSPPSLWLFPSFPQQHTCINLSSTSNSATSPSPPHTSIFSLSYFLLVSSSSLSLLFFSSQRFLKLVHSSLSSLLFFLLRLTHGSNYCIEIHYLKSIHLGTFPSTD